MAEMKLEKDSGKDSPKGIESKGKESNHGKKQHYMAGEMPFHEGSGPGRGHGKK